MVVRTGQTKISSLEDWSSQETVAGSVESTWLKS